MALLSLLLSATFCSVGLGRLSRFVDPLLWFGSIIFVCRRVPAGGYGFGISSGRLALTLRGQAVSRRSALMSRQGISIVAVSAVRRPGIDPTHIACCRPLRG